jgi:hypothetical protein
MEKDTVKKANFKELPVQLELDGKPVKMDVRKDIGNFIYQNSRDLDALELAQKIYRSDGEIELTQTEVTTITGLIEESRITLPLRLALLNIAKQNA